MPRASTTSDAFNAVAEPRRREILEFLGPEERAVGEIALALGVEQPSVSKHLQVLLNVGLVEMRRDGRRTLYRTNADALRPVHEWTGTVREVLGPPIAPHQSARRGQAGEIIVAAGLPPSPRLRRTAVARRAEAVSPPRGNHMAIAPPLDNLTLDLSEEVHVRASLEETFDSIVAQMGRLNETPDGKPFPMVLESWPGGRWYRDLGGDNGHLWGHVQSIKRPTLLEIYGPLFMSYPTMSNLQYRLKDVEGGTLIVFRHTAFGFIQDDHRMGVAQGWTPLLARIRRDAEQGQLA